MFHDLIRELEKDGHIVVITSRPLANTIALLTQSGLAHTVIGEHYGKNIYKKIIGFPIRIFQLMRFLKHLRIDLAISQSSFHSPVTARLLGIPSIYMNDNEHALGNIPSFLFATKILVPEFLHLKMINGIKINKNKFIGYPGVKEGIYLWQSYLTSEIQLESEVKIQKKIYIRPEPRTAQYYKGDLNFLDDVIVSLKERLKIVLLIRDKEQLKHYRAKRFSGIHVPEDTLFFNNIAKDCLLFIGAGGTMTREMAVIGIPTISVYQDDLLEVDKYLIKLGLMKHFPKITLEKVLEYINQNNSKTPNRNLLLKGKESYTLIKALIKEADNKANHPL